jgi:hypothetical protein
MRHRVGSSAPVYNTSLLPSRTGIDTLTVRRMAEAAPAPMEPAPTPGVDRSHTRQP